MSLQMALCCQFLWLNSIPSYKYPTSLSSHLLKDILGCFHVLAGKVDSKTHWQEHFSHSRSDILRVKMATLCGIMRILCVFYNVGYIHV